MFSSVDIEFSTFINIVVIILFVQFVVYVASLFYRHLLLQRASKDGVILEVSIDKHAEQDPFTIERLWSDFHGMRLNKFQSLFKSQPFFAFEIKSEASIRRKTQEITFNIWVQKEYVKFFEQRIKAHYRNAVIREVEDYIPRKEETVEGGGTLTIKTAELSLKEDSAFNIKTFEDFDSDPLRSLTHAMSDVNNREKIIVQIVAEPESYKWRKKAIRTLNRFERTGVKPKKRPDFISFFSGSISFIVKIIDSFITSLLDRNPDIDVSTPQRTTAIAAEQKDIFEKTKYPPYKFQIRVLVATNTDEEDAERRLNSVIASFNGFEGERNGFKREFVLNKKATLKRMQDRHLHVLDTNDILTTKELAGLCHFPNKDLRHENIKRNKTANRPVPQGIAEDFPFATSMDGRKLVGLNEKGRFRHVYISGMTGVGKSTILSNMIVQDIENGNGCVVIDPHGDLIDEVLEKVSARREDIYLLDPADVKYPFGLNLLELTSTDEYEREKEKTLVIDAYITVMKRVFGESSIGANTDDLFRMSCSAILDTPEGGGLMEMVLMLTSANYRDSVIPYIKDPIVRDYWEQVFPTLVGNSNFQSQNLNPPLNKLRRFVANGMIANIICQRKSTLNIENAINSGAVILARFSRGDIGFENSTLLGSMLVSKIQIAAMQRVKIPEEERIPCYLYLDEFQNFVADDSGAKTFAEILSEARKYKLGLIIANQFVQQLKMSGDFLSEAIFNNCGTTITFRVGKTDSEFFEKIYYDTDTQDGIRSNDLANLGLGEVAMRIVDENGTQTEPFIAKTFPPVPEHEEANPELIRRRSREAICVHRDKIREDIANRMSYNELVEA